MLKRSLTFFKEAHGFGREGRKHASEEEIVLFAGKGMTWQKKTLLPAVAKIYVLRRKEKGCRLNEPDLS